MKILQVIVVSTFFIVPVVAFSNDFFTEEQAPLQSYQVAQEEPAPQTAKISNPVPQGNSPAGNNKFSAGDAQEGTNSSLLQVMESQINQLNQQALLYQQQTSSKTEQLSSQYEALHDRLQDLNQAMVLLNQKLSQIESLQHSQQEPMEQSLENKTSPEQQAGAYRFKLPPFVMKYFPFFLTACLAALMGALFARQNRAKNRITQASQQKGAFSVPSLSMSLNTEEKLLLSQLLQKMIREDGDTKQREAIEKIVNKIQG